ncbi:hypothetical protein GOHSU_16_00760 [Gordonia hirsuta DSM 44140 = NBRC 16056]|uniref:Threonine/serine exporter-like N-terminal domain-containing protein n=1 Tax=Gordonia hirsuta DSM 44140 = NBRC 16056 TaxID=1121927 RepID=L7L881_9ACTN|nr:threonine/serine exporter family protein [Gordonia hirsuta]GAC57119.1 hypothetical protein GOHSU_16_00760 [Gordonia hirsuta DSM 44140 = NBRC 16056]
MPAPMHGRFLEALTAIQPVARPVVTAATGTADDFAQMLGAVGTAMISSSQPTNDVESALLRLAIAYNRTNVVTVVLPTAVFVQTVVDGVAQTAMFPVEGAALRLDQTDAVQRMVDKILTADTPPEPAHVIAKLAKIATMPPRFNRVVALVGYMLMTVGFGMMVNTSASALPAYVGLGLLVGLIVMVGNRLPTLAVVLQVLTPFIVTIVCIKYLAEATGANPLVLLAPPLLLFLPGSALTIGAMELTDGQMIAGASRTVSGIAQLSLLSFGVVAGVAVAGELPHSHPGAPLGAWASWVGILAFSAGFALFSSAPRWSLPWIIVTLLAAHAMQVAIPVPDATWLSGFFGALVLVPVARVLALFKPAPPAVVTSYCGFQMLVPGATSFESLTAAASTGSASTTAAMQVVATFIAIALGMLVGSGLSRDLANFVHDLRRSPSTTVDPVDNTRLLAAKEIPAEIPGGPISTEPADGTFAGRWRRWRTLVVDDGSRIVDDAERIGHAVGQSGLGREVDKLTRGHGLTEPTGPDTVADDADTTDGPGPHTAD